MTQTISLKAKVQVIFYQTKENELGQTHATSDKRITIIEAGEILQDRGLDFHEVLKVKYEYVDLNIPLENFNQYIK